MYSSSVVLRNVGVVATTRGVATTSSSSSSSASRRLLVFSLVNGSCSSSLGHHVLRSQQGSPLMNSTRGYRSLFVNPPENETPSLTSLDIMDQFASDIGQAREYSKSGLEETLRQRSSLMEFLPKSVEDLPPRRMEDSFVSAVIPLRSRADIRERYVTFEGNVRIGRVLEDMDVFSVFCCFRHILNPLSVGKKNPYSVVTALVDSIHFGSDAMRNDEDVRLSGHVSYVGRSSLEVSVVLDQKERTTGKYMKVCEAVFLMVARDPMNTGPAIVNPLVAGNAQEEEFLKRGQERQRRRKELEAESLYRVPPTEEEREVIHSKFLENWGGEKHNSSSSSSGDDLMTTPTGAVNMVDTKLKTVFICHPQYRNRYNKIFGGFIMRQATELAFTNAYLYAKRRPHILNIDDILFRRPVEIGSILRFSASVGYVENEFVHCPVKAEVINPRTNELHLSNMFHFTFNVKGSLRPPPLNFSSYQEGIEYLNSRRHFRKMMDDFVFKKQQTQY